MKQTAFVFAVLLAICLLIGACSKQGEVEQRSETIPQPVEEAALDETTDTGTVVDTAMADTMAADTSASGEH